MATSAVAAAAARARRAVIDHFLEADAVSPDKAVPFTPHHRLERRLFDRLRARGVLVAAKDGGHYLDAPAFAAYQKSQRKLRGLALAAAALAMGAGVAIGLVG